MQRTAAGQCFEQFFIDWVQLKLWVVIEFRTVVSIDIVLNRFRVVVTEQSGLKNKIVRKRERKKAGKREKEWRQCPLYCISKSATAVLSGKRGWTSWEQEWTVTSVEWYSNMTTTLGYSEQLHWLLFLVREEEKGIQGYRCTQYKPTKVSLLQFSQYGVSLWPSPVHVNPPILATKLEK